MSRVAAPLTCQLTTVPEGGPSGSDEGGNGAGPCCLAALLSGSWFLMAATFKPQTFRFVLVYLYLCGVRSSAAESNLTVCCHIYDLLEHDSWYLSSFSTAQTFFQKCFNHGNSKLSKHSQRIWGAFLSSVSDFSINGQRTSGRFSLDLWLLAYPHLDPETLWKNKHSFGLSGHELACYF